MKTTGQKSRSVKTPEYKPEFWECWRPGDIGYTYAVGPNGNCPIAKTLGGDAAMNQANARLIAAAPELLQALQSARDWIARHRDSSDDQPPMTEIASAIIKATR